MPDRRPFTITALRLEDGYWKARVTAGGAGFDVDRKHGSWQIVLGEGEFEKRADVKHEVAAALQAKVTPRENAARKAAERAAKEAAEAEALEEAA